VSSSALVSLSVVSFDSIHISSSQLLGSKIVFSSCVGVISFSVAVDVLFEHHAAEIKNIHSTTIGISFCFFMSIILY
jgi:hypothetical protein